MKEIPLTHGYVALVDDEDYECVAALKWHSDIRSGTYGTRVYARSNSRVGKKGTHIRMHQFIMGLAARYDHADGNGINNQRYNLREANNSQNGANGKSIGASGFRGVSWHSGTRSWQVRVYKDKLLVYGAYCKDKADAATVYNFIAFEVHGEFARMNTSLRASPSSVPT